jgi:hypothetical protein
MMKKRNEPLRVELIPSPATLVRESTGLNKAELERIVQQKVAEIMAERDAIVFEPFFRSRQIAYELQRLQTVSEREKFSVYFERYGYLICETRKTIHAGNGMCGNCRNRTFVRLTQIVAEGIKGQPARQARGTNWEQRLLPPNGPRDGVHQTWYNRSNATDQALYERVATKLGVTLEHVRSVARCQRHSEAVSDAIKKERARLVNGADE